MNISSYTRLFRYLGNQTTDIPLRFLIQRSVIYVRGFVIISYDNWETKSPAETVFFKRNAITPQYISRCLDISRI